MTTKWIPARRPKCSTTVESSLQIDLFMQNKANFQKSQVNVRPLVIMNYERKSNWTFGENKPNSKPNKANLHFTAENTEYAGKKDISVSDCSLKKYALYPISPCSGLGHPVDLRTRRLMKNKAKTKPIFKSEDRRQKTEDRRQKTEDRRQKTEDRRQKAGVQYLINSAIVIKWILAILTDFSARFARSK